ncbi:hypothetical protein PCK2_000942 [Pneumocystis canis]|nr:hypothetical protein PCK2_000942 [Pneumocystis canis]
MIGFSVFWIFFSWIFEGSTQNKVNTEQTHWVPYKRISVLLNGQCFFSDMDRIYDKQTSVEKKEELNNGINKDSENLVESLFISFEEWKKYSTFNTLDGNEKEDINRIEDDSKNDPYKMNHGKELDHSISVNDPINNPKNEVEKQKCVSYQNSIHNLSDFNNYSRVSSKERFNYASVDCAATVLEANSEAKGSSFILSSDKDQYMLNKCSASHKFVIVELCNDILIDTIVLGNLEFFSSTFKDFRVSVSDRYSTEGSRWKELGIFTAMNIKDIQIFTIVNPLIWAKYIRIDFLTHYGDEFYCPVTFLRVYGTTMIEELKYDDNEFKENTQINHNVPSFENSNLEQQSGVKLGVEKCSLKEQKINSANCGISEISSLPFQDFVNIPVSINYTAQDHVENIGNSIRSFPVCLVSTFSLQKIFDQKFDMVSGKMDPVSFSNTLL